MTNDFSTFLFVRLNFFMAVTQTIFLFISSLCLGLKINFYKNAFNLEEGMEHKQPHNHNIVIVSSPRNGHCL